MVCEKSKCTGCFACYNICPKNAIEMKEDELGNIYPFINEKKCIKCNLCRKVCPSINQVSYTYPKKCYAMQSKEENIISSSTSGGAATVFAKKILQNNGIVYGVAVTENIDVKYIRIEHYSDLKKVKGSKYVHAYVNDIFRYVKKDLENNLEVLFIGTPCQVAGLKKFLHRGYENLFLIDIICHGVPSQKLLREEIGNKNIDNITFRGTDGFKIKLYKNGNVIDEKERVYSKYYDGFMQALFYRENCYQCQYARPERVSDITIGDFWGLNSDSKLYNNRSKGISVILPITDKGLKLVDECEEEMVLEERTVQEAIHGNTQLREPSKKSKKSDKFQKYYIKYGLNKAYNKVMYKEILKRELKKIKIIEFLHKKMKGLRNGRK